MKIDNLRSLIRESIKDYISEIDEAAEIAGNAARINKTLEAIKARKDKLARVEENEELKEMVDGAKIKEIQNEIKELEKAEKKFRTLAEKRAAKKAKKSAPKEEDEVVTDAMTEDAPPIDETDVMAQMEIAEESTEEALNESFLKMQKLAGVITESEYNKKKRLIENQLNERVEIMNKLDQANPDYNYRNMLKIQPYPDGKEYYAQVIGLFTDDNKDKIEKYHVRIFSTNDANSSATLGEYTEEDLKKMKAVKIDDNDPEINDTIKKHKRYLKY